MCKKCTDRINNYKYMYNNNFSYIEQPYKIYQQNYKNFKRTSFSDVTISNNLRQSMQLYTVMPHAELQLHRSNKRHRLALIDPS